MKEQQMLHLGLVEPVIMCLAPILFRQVLDAIQAGILHHFQVSMLHSEVDA